MMLVAFTFSFIGFALLSLSMKRHFSQVYKNNVFDSRRAFLLRVIAYVCLLLSCATCLRGYGIGVGLVWWLGLLTLTALLQTLLLTYQPQRRATTFLGRFD